MAGNRDKNLPLAETLESPSTPRDQVIPASGSGPTLESAATGETVLSDPPLAEGTAIGERYVIASMIGRGGMGTVYLARDVTLGRDVALKLHRHGANHDRLYREALAMAQLAHPNVVTVFEVGTFDDQLFVAMEYVRGETLRDWVTKQPRSWREIVDILRAVGEGLYAAHRAELVHRDFKPENVLVGDDGRARVSDFGLARTNASIDSRAPASITSTGPTSPASVRSGSSLPLTGPMTVTGALLGTPAYMSPEQFAGDDLDARSDQFSFCVAAWECLYGRRPFAGATLPQLQQAIERGQLDVPDGAAVPASVRRVLERGLAAIPAARWPSMRELLAALEAATRRRSRRYLVLAAAAGLLAAGGTAAWLLSRTDGPQCDAAGTELDAILTPGMRVQLIALARSVGDDDVVRRTTANLARFATRYGEVANAACRAHAKHDWSDDLAARALTCRRDEAYLVAAELAGYSKHITSARTLISMTTQLGELGELTSCSDPTVLASMPERPAATRDAIGREIAALGAARRFIDADKPDLARKELDRVSASPVATAPSVVAALALLRGQIAEHAGDYASAVREARDAYYKAHSNGDRSIEIVALRELLYRIGTEEQDLAAVEPWYQLALAELDRFARISKPGAARLRLAIVGVAVNRNEIKVAVEQAKLAVDGFGTAFPVAHAQAVREYAGALAAAGDYANSIAAYEQAAEELQRTVGPEDLDIAPTLADEALTLMQAGQNDKAVEVGKRALALAKHQRERDVELANVELNVSATLIEGGLDDLAEPLLTDARQQFVAAFGATNPVIATIDSNLSLIASDRGKYEDAVALLKSAIAIQEKAFGTTHPDVAISLYNLAAALKRANDLAGALVAARRCTAIRAASLATSDMYIYALAMQADLEADLGDFEAALRDINTAFAVTAPRAGFQATAWPELVKARALVALRREPAIARRLLDHARKLYADNQMTERVAQIDALLAKLAP